jgi:hypothetical protein
MHPRDGYIEQGHTSSHELFSSNTGVDIFNICLNEVSRRRCYGTKKKKKLSIEKTFRAMLQTLKKLAYFSFFPFHSFLLTRFCFLEQLK